MWKKSSKRYFNVEKVDLFNSFYKKYYNFILFRAKEILNGDYYRAEDIAQDCMIKLGEKEMFDYIINMDEEMRKKYIISMVDNCSVDFIRKEKRYILHTSEDVKNHYNREESSIYKKTDPYKKVALRMEVLDMINSMMTLSDKDKWIFKCLLCYDMKIKDIARVCNITMSGVRKRLLRARLKLYEDRLAWQV